MLDPDLKQSLDQINKNLFEINRKTRSSVWRSFVTGALSGLGSIFGVALALLMLGWILNVIGVIPALKNQVHQFQQTLEQIQKGK